MSSHPLDDDDDAWSYSFPPSTDSLPLKKGSLKEPSVAPATALAVPREPKKPPEIVHHYLQADSASSSDSEDQGARIRRPSPQPSSANSSINGPIDIKARKDPLQTLQGVPHSSSLSLLTLQLPFLVKLTPANPHTTIEDANLIISKDSLGNDQSSVHGLASPTLKNAMRASIEGALLAEAPEPKPGHTPSASIDLATSPKVIAYRKTSGRRSNSENTFQGLDDPDDRYDPKLYDKEKFKDSSYRYAAMKRNTDFHQLFRALDLTDRLLDDFSCALSREILLQGRIYVSENNVCFNSNLLGWVTNIVIPMSDIIKFEKKTTAGLFPNGISVETVDTKHTFASFLSRDATYEFLKTVWQATTGKTMVMSQPSTELNQGNSPQFNSYLLSIDGDEKNGVADSDEIFEDKDVKKAVKDENDDFSDLESGTRDNPESRLENPVSDVLSTSVVKLKPDSQYVNMGPDAHIPTTLEDDENSPENDETELCNETIQAPMGIVYDILFGSANTAFHKTFLENHDASDISDYDKFHPMEEDPSKLERKITYKRALNYAIGPKSTKCEISEVIEHLNFASNIIVETSTTTPDVPLGNSFSVKTRYRFTWGLENSTNLRISYYIKWTGRSWIRSVIEKLTLSGQTSTTKDLIEALQKEIDEHTHVTEGPVAVETKEEVVVVAPPVPPKVPPKPVEKEVLRKEFSSREYLQNNIVLVCYFIVSFLILLLILQLRLTRMVKENNLLAKSQLLVNLNLISSINGGKHLESLDLSPDQKDLWTWVNSKHAKKLTTIEKTEYLNLQLRALYAGPQRGQKLTDLANKVKEGDFQDLLNPGALRDVLGDLL